MFVLEFVSLRSSLDISSVEIYSSEVSNFVKASTYDSLTLLLYNLIVRVEYLFISRIDCFYTCLNTNFGVREELICAFDFKICRRLYVSSQLVTVISIVLKKE